MAVQEAGRISLPPGRLDEVIGEAHEWVAGASLDAGDHAMARAEYLQAPRLRPARVDLLLRLALSLMPAQLVARTRQLQRAAKTRLITRRRSEKPAP